MAKCQVVNIPVILTFDFLCDQSGSQKIPQGRILPNRQHDWQFLNKPLQGSKFCLFMGSHSCNTPGKLKECADPKDIPNKIKECVVENDHVASYGDVIRPGDIPI
jgi:hypothetical protein